MNDHVDALETRLVRGWLEQIPVDVCPTRDDIATPERDHAMTALLEATVDPRTHETGRASQEDAGHAALLGVAAMNRDDLRYRRHAPQLGLNTMVGSKIVESQFQTPSGPRLMPKSMLSPATTGVVTSKAMPAVLPLAMVCCQRMVAFLRM
jgi:hypothetical protein